MFSHLGQRDTFWMASFSKAYSILLTLNLELMKNYTLFLAAIGFSLFLFSCRSNTLEVKVFDENGQLSEQYVTLLPDSVKHGTYKGFYPSGAVYEEARYAKGALVGERKLFHESGGMMTLETYKNGRLEGKYQTYYENGQIEIDRQYINNAIQKESKKYYESGELEEVVYFVDNLENGPFKEYYKNGHLKAVGTYKDGDQEHGLLELYNEQGELVRKMQCDLGICKTIWEKEGDDNQ